MGKSRSQIQAEYVERKGWERLDVQVPVGTKERLKALAEHHRVTIGKMIERLVIAEEQPAMSDVAREMFARCGGDVAKARQLLLEDLRNKYPGFIAPGTGQAKREYNAIRRQLHDLKKTEQVTDHHP